MTGPLRYWIFQLFVSFILGTEAAALYYIAKQIGFLR